MAVHRLQTATVHALVSDDAPTARSVEPVQQQTEATPCTSVGTDSLDASGAYPVGDCFWARAELPLFAAPGSTQRSGTARAGARLHVAIDDARGRTAECGTVDGQPGAWVFVRSAGQQGWAWGPLLATSSDLEPD